MSSRKRIYLQCCFPIESTSCEGAEGNAAAAICVSCKHKAIVNKEVRVSKPPLLSPRREVLFLCRLGICSLSCLKVIAVLEMDI